MTSFVRIEDIFAEIVRDEKGPGPAAPSKLTTEVTSLSKSTEEGELLMVELKQTASSVKLDVTFKTERLGDILR